LFSSNRWNLSLHGKDPNVIASSFPRGTFEELRRGKLALDLIERRHTVLNNARYTGPVAR
jgi:hypothetical protein